jgi:excisionase family DNA binding protein
MSSHLTAAIEALIEEEVRRRSESVAVGTSTPVTVGEFAVQTRLSKSTVYGLIRTGRLKTVPSMTRRVLIPAAELDAYLKAEGAA